MNADSGARDGRFAISPPCYLVSGKTKCWRCSAAMSAVAVLCMNPEHANEPPVFLQYATELSPEILHHVRQISPTFRLKYARTVNFSYYANTCPTCGVVCGDHYLFSEPGAVFWPMSSEETVCLMIEHIPLQDSAFAKARYSCGGGIPLIIDHARRLEARLNDAS